MPRMRVKFSRYELRCLRDQRVSVRLRSGKRAYV